MEALPQSQSISREQNARLGQVFRLIGLLDRYLFLRGETLTSYNPTDPSSYANPTGVASNVPKANIPVSLQWFPEVELSDHLRDLEREMEELKTLTATISSICLSTEVVALAKSQIVNKYRGLKPVADIEDFRSKSIAQMLAILRAEQKLVHRPVVETTSINVVIGIKSDGKVSSMGW